MDTPNTSPPVEHDIFAPEPSPLSSTRNILLLAAALLVTIGFFLPWISQGGGGRDFDYDYDFDIPTINGTYLLSNVTDIPEVGWLLTIFLLMIPAGGIIVAYCSSQSAYSERLVNFGLASAIFIPLSLLAFYLVMPNRALIGELGRVKLGIGFILMGAGAVYLFIYAISRIGSNLRNISAGPMLKCGLIGGVVTGVVLYLVLKGMRNPGTSLIYLYLFLVIGGILLSVYIHGTGDRVNYHAGLVTGFIFSAAYVFTLLIIASMENNSGMVRVGESIVFLLVFHSLFGYVISSLVATGKDSTGVPDDFEFENTTATVPHQPSPSEPGQP